MNFLNNLKIRVKLLISFSLFAVLMLVAGGRIFYVLQKMEEKSSDVVKSFVLADHIMEAKYSMRTDMQLVMEMLAAPNMEELTEFNNDHNNAVKDFDENIEGLITGVNDESWGFEFNTKKKEVATKAEMLDNLHNSKIMPAINELYATQKEIMETGSNTEDEKLRALDRGVDTNAHIVINELTSIEESVTKLVENSLLASKKIEAQSKFEITIIITIGIIMALILGIVITNNISNPLKKAVEFAQTFASGDLTATIEIEQRDELGILGDSLLQMRNKLEEVVSSIMNASTQIADASTEMNGSSQQMSEGATNQASSVEEISASMEEMAANIQQNTDNAKETEKTADAAALSIKESSSSVNKTVASMETITDKISIIGDISRQTNLLALNAAVEAARAGEHGKGFAVVAGEIRKLAERSQAAATDIDDVSKSSVDIAQKSGKMLNDVVPEIQNNANLVREITAASIEQTSGANQINQAIQQLNQVVQQNAAVSEEMAASAEELNAQAEMLKETIAFFKVKGSHTGDNSNELKA